MILWFARQHRPQLIDMLFQRIFRVRNIFTGGRFREPEVVLDEASQIKIAVAFNLAIADQNIQRIHFRCTVGEGFAIGKQFRRLNVFEQLEVTIGGS